MSPLSASPPEFSRLFRSPMHPVFHSAPHESKLSTGLPEILSAQAPLKTQQYIKPLLLLRFSWIDSVAFTTYFYPSSLERR